MLYYVYCWYVGILFYYSNQNKGYLRVWELFKRKYFLIENLKKRISLVLSQNIENYLDGFKNVFVVLLKVQR